MLLTADIKGADCMIIAFMGSYGYDPSLLPYEVCAGPHLEGNFRPSLIGYRYTTYYTKII